MRCSRVANADLGRLHSRSAQHEVSQLCPWLPVRVWGRKTAEQATQHSQLCPFIPMHETVQQAST